jgi:uncharacterized lipoprotein YmbA
MTSLFRRSLAVTMLTTMLAACGTVPMQKTYVLGDPPLSTTGVSSEANRPVIELKTVSVPDYLDSTDILRRTGPNQVTASPTGRWGERLSLGLTDALASALSRRLPNLVVTTMPSTEPARRVFVDIERIDVDGAGQCLMTARWRISGKDGHGTVASEHGTFDQAAASIDDPALASAMTRLVDQLAEQVAATIAAK